MAASKSALENSRDRIFELAQVFLAEAALAHGGRSSSRKDGGMRGQPVAGAGCAATRDLLEPRFLEEAPLAEGVLISQRDRH